MKWIHGYIECQFNWVGWWQGVFPIEEPLNDRVRIFYAKMFDVDNQTGLRPVADRRGLPSDLSEEAKKLPSYGSSDTFNESYATLKEVRMIARGHISEPVKQLLETMEKLSAAHGERNVRLVVWFSDDGKTKSW